MQSSRRLEIVASCGWHQEYKSGVDHTKWVQAKQKAQSSFFLKRLTFCSVLEKIFRCSAWGKPNIQNPGSNIYVNLFFWVGVDVLIQFIEMLSAWFSMARSFWWRKNCVRSMCWRSLPAKLFWINISWKSDHKMTYVVTTFRGKYGFAMNGIMALTWTTLFVSRLWPDLYWKR